MWKNLLFTDVRSRTTVFWLFTNRTLWSSEAHFKWLHAVSAW
jgi:hypothetical protein